MVCEGLVVNDDYWGGGGGRSHMEGPRKDSPVYKHVSCNWDLSVKTDAEKGTGYLSLFHVACYTCY